MKENDTFNAVNSVRSGGNAKASAFRILLSLSGSSGGFFVVILVYQMEC